MTRTRTTISALLAAATLALAGCAGSTGEAPGDTEPASTEPASTAPAATSDAGEGSGETEAPGAAGELIGMVGTADDPEAYEIALLDADGSPVASLPAGDYTLTFDDRSRMHNFHLTGPGVDVMTDVQGSDGTAVEITLVAGTYAFICDPHAGTMMGEVEVTG